MKRSIYASIIIIGILAVMGITIGLLNNSSVSIENDQPIKITTNKDQYYTNEIVEIKVKNVGIYSVQFSNPTGNIKVYNIENNQPISTNIIQPAVHITFEKGQEFTTERDLGKQLEELESGIYEIQVRYQLPGDDELRYSYHQFEIIN